MTARLTSLLLLLSLAGPVLGQVAFERTAKAPTGRSPEAVGIGDFDRDGVFDLVVANSLDDTVAFTRGVLTDGEWLPVDEGFGRFFTSVPAGLDPLDLAVGDFDGDGLLDAVTADAVGGTVTWLRGTGSIPERSRSTAVPAGPHRLRAADFDRDGLMDLVVACESNVAVLRGRAGGAFEVQALGVPAVGAVIAAEFGDANGDGRTDVGVIALRPGTMPGRPFLPSDFFLYSRDAGGRFVLATSFPFDPALVDATDLRATDLDSDGVTDWAAAGAGGGITVRDAIGLSAAVFVATPDTVRTIDSADADGDGFLDLAVLTRSPSAFTVHLNDGARGLSAGTPFPCGAGPTGFDFGDFDADGRIDAVVVSNRGNVLLDGLNQLYSNESAPPCARGNVNAGAGSRTPVDVLFVNGSNGGGRRQVTAFPAEPFRIRMAAPPSLATAPFALYVWEGWPDAFGSAFEIPGVGRSCFPTPLSAGSPAPVVVWNNTGRMRLGAPTLPSVPAPSSPIVSPRGVRRPQPVRVYLQGIIADAASASGRGASVTNGVLLQIR